MRFVSLLCLSLALAVVPLACEDANRPAVPTELAIIVQPRSVTAGVAISPAVQVEVQDGQGNVMTGSTASVTLAITSGTGTAGATLSGTLSQPTVDGVATFDKVMFDKTGSGYELTASATGLTSATTAAFTVSPGAPAKLAFMVEPSAVTAGATFAPAVQVAVVDTLANPVTSATACVGLSITSGTGATGAVLGGTATVDVLSGIATFSDLTLDRVGPGYTLTATAPDLTGAVSTTFPVTPGAASKLVFTVEPSTDVAGTAIHPAVQVTVQDAQGNTATSASASVTVALASGTGAAGAVLAGTVTVGAADGVTAFGDLTVDKAGTGYILTATATGLDPAASTAFDIVPRRYLVADLGSLGGDDVQPAAINGSGQVVGSATLPSGETRAFLWSPDSPNGVTGHMTDLGVPTGYTATAAVDINDAGQAVGNATPETGYSGWGILWDAGGMQLIFGPAGSSYSHAAGINAGGMVLLLSGSPYIWDKGTLTPIGSGWSPTAWMASGINDSAVVVGSMTFGAGAGTQIAWTFAGGVTSWLGNWVPVAVNASGQIIGNGQPTLGNTGPAMLWENGAGTVLTGLQAGVTDFALRGINNLGQIVGVSGARGVVWEGGVTYDLNAMLPRGSGFEVTSATDINDRGQIIAVGRSSGVRRAVLLSPAP